MSVQFHLRNLKLLRYLGYRLIDCRNMRDHTKLRAFKLADEIAVLIYKVIKGFPKDEIYGLTSQMRSSAV